MRLEKKQIRFFSLGEKGNGLYDLKKLEGGSYISDWTRNMGDWHVTRAHIPEFVARLILKELELGTPHEFGNKNFVRITGPEDVSGHDDREVHTFLYKHDFRWYLYTLNL